MGKQLQPFFYPLYSAPALTCVVPHRQALHFSKLIPAYSTATFGKGRESKKQGVRAPEATRGSADPHTPTLPSALPGPTPPAAPAQPRKQSLLGASGTLPGAVAAGRRLHGPAATATAAVPRCLLRPHPRPAGPRACAPTLGSWAEGGGDIGKTGGARNTRQPEPRNAVAAPTGPCPARFSLPLSVRLSPLPAPSPSPFPAAARLRHSGGEDPHGPGAGCGSQ